MGTEGSGISKFSELEIRGFRRLVDVKVQMRTMCALIGANGIGKTSILDSIWLLGRSAEGRLNDAISELGGVTSFLSYGRDSAKSIHLQIKMQTPEAPLVYQLEIEPGGTGYKLPVESLTQARYGLPADKPFRHIQGRHAQVQYFDPVDQKLIRPTWEYNPLESALFQVPKMFDAPESFRNRLASVTTYHSLDVRPRAPVRLPQAMRPATLPGKDGEDIVSCLYTMRESERSRFEAVEDALRAAFPGFDRLEFPPVAAGTLALVWRDKRLGQPLYMHQLSEGTLRFLWLATLLQSSGLTAMTLLDEPEVSLHPELLSLLAELMREASKRTQLVIATHSDRLIRFLKPEEVLCMDDSEDHGTKMTWADQLDLDRWLADYSLDEVWQMGRMGARA